MNAQTSYYQSELPSESFQSAEQNALIHEMRAKKKQQDKEAKLMQFQSKTKANAMRKMREGNEAKRLSSAEQKKQQVKENQMKAKLYAQQTRKAVHVKVGAGSQKGDTRGNQESGIGKDSSLHQQFVKDMSSITQMGIINIENESLSKISPLKRDASQNLSSKIIEEVSEENQS